ncbi:MAG: hypothetical protein WDA16_00735 [Candidatus Thermoplasmatota archaeon]
MMDSQELGDGFYLHDKCVFYDEVRTKRDFHALTMVFEWDRALAFDAQPHVLQVTRQRNFIDSLETSGADLGVQSERGIQHAVGQPDHILRNRFSGHSSSSGASGTAGPREPSAKRLGPQAHLMILPEP